MLTNRATGSRTVDYSSRGSCCADIAWAGPHRLFFADDNHTFTLDPAKGKARFVAAFSDFYASPDGVWVAGHDDPPPHEPQFAAVVNVASRTCVLIPGTRNYVGSQFGPPTGFSRDGKYVVAAKLSGAVARYRISSLDDPCPTE